MLYPFRHASLRRSTAIERKTATNRLFHKQDDGFSTVGMVLALLISVSLILGSAQVYRVQTAAAGVQNVADACALAAEKQVASFYIVAQVCDSAILSLSLAGTLTVGLGIVAACVPAAQEFSLQLVDMGKKILNTRTRFAQACIESLNTLQSLLPIFAAIDTAAVAQANSVGDAHYLGISVLLPFGGQELDVPSTDEDAMLADIDNSRNTIAEAAVNAEEAAQKAHAHKHEAYMADCGGAPAYCMYERATSLAGMSGSQNPYYASEDTWSFSVPLKRAQLYYRYRLNHEAPVSDTIAEQAKSAIRFRFYTYAVDMLNDAYVHETDDTFKAYFPLLPRNTADMRATVLYTEAVYPVSEDEEGLWTMHAWSGCPRLLEEGHVGVGSVQQMEEAGYKKCPVCEFSASSVGKVAAASTSIENGFEHHYLIVAQQAALYEKERDAFLEQARAVKSPTQEVFDQLKKLLLAASDSRIKVQPPGRTGALAIVLEPGGVSAADVMPNSLVNPVAPLGPCLAISAATLADDDADEAKTVISSLLDGLFQDRLVPSLAGSALHVWSKLLVAYSQGSHGISSGIEQALNALPLIGMSGLGTWAAHKFEDMVASAGFSPPDLVSHKPVLVNSYYVAAADDSGLASGLVHAKQTLAQSYGGVPAGTVSAVVSVAGGKLLSSYSSWDARFVIASIDLFGSGGISIPIEITLPPAIKQSSVGLIETALDALLSLSSQTIEVRRWE